MFRTDYRKHVKDSLEEEKTAFILKYFYMKEEEKINAVIQCKKVFTQI